MRSRLALLAALLALVLSATPAHAGIRIEQDAHAVFVLPKSDGVYPAVFVSASRMTGTNVGFVIHLGRCLDPDDFDSCIIGTRDRAVGGNFRDGDIFEFDDDLGYAHLKVRRDGVTHEVTWRASDAATATVSDTNCGLVPVGTAAGLERQAETSGTVFGKSLRDARVLTASLSVVAYTC